LWCEKTIVVPDLSREKNRFSTTVIFLCRFFSPSVIPGLIPEVFKKQALCLSLWDTMEIKALVKYRDQYAEYRISQEKTGIFLASLERYEGSVHTLPPPTITMTKGVRHWIGSTDEQPLIDDLGEIIDLNSEVGLLSPSGEDNKLDEKE
jgi:hypothetical protein